MSSPVPLDPVRRRRRWWWIAAGLIGALLGLGVLQRLRSPRETALMRGLVLADELGCFGCHGPEGGGGHPNPSSPLEEVPPLKAGASLAFFVRNEGEIREWILHGRPARVEASAPRPGLIRMPAYAGFVTDAQVDDLVACVQYLSARPRPATPAAEQGLATAERLGCFACHGPGGRGGLANPGSFKGYIPPWDGEDFAELVADDEELRQWIRAGAIERFNANPLARFFLARQAIQMPAYEGLASAQEVEALVAYIHWLRADGREADAEVPAAGLPDASAVERGRWLYRHTGCIACHGTEGRGGVSNENAPGGLVPSLTHTAERLQLLEREHAESLLAELERGTLATSTAPIPDLETVLVEYRALRATILRGSRPARRDGEGPAPPLLMPPWDRRACADQGPLSAADIDALIAYLVSLQPWDELAPAGG